MDEVLWRVTRRRDSRQRDKEYHSRRGAVHGNGGFFVRQLAATTGISAVRVEGR